MKITGSNSFERSYTLEGAAWSAMSRIRYKVLLGKLCRSFGYDGKHVLSTMPPVALRNNSPFSRATHCAPQCYSLRVNDRIAFSVAGGPWGRSFRSCDLGRLCDEAQGPLALALSQAA